MTHLTILNFKLEIISSTTLPVQRGWAFRGIQIDNQDVYLTIYRCHQIFIYNQDTKIFKNWGTVKLGSDKNQFNNPSGLSLENKNIYICDRSNDRIQILNKSNGNFINQWNKRGTGLGEFSYPISIYYSLSDITFYIGHYFSIQMFNKNGRCEQRLGSNKNGKEMNQFDSVYGICILDDLLYAADCGNSRVQIFRRK